MKFSIILPTYNVENYISRCLLSCINQSWKNIEIIIVDDCGQDNSLNIANDFSREDPRIKIIKYPKNVGTYHARRIGAEHASGDYILFLDPDDEIKLSAIEEIQKILVSPADLILYGSHRVPSPNFWQLSPKVPMIKNSYSYIKSLNLIFNCKQLSYGTEGKVIKRDVLLKSYQLLNIPKDKRITYAEDALLFSSILLVAKKILSFPSNLYIYYKNETSITESKSKDAIQYNISQIDFIIETVSNLPIKNEYSMIIKSNINKRLFLDKLRLLNKIEKRKSKIIKNHAMIISKTKSIRDAIKFLISLCR
ncbi:TPA: glycosyltransferase family 2 protein [Providencia alcalifaciens]|uniref:Lipooligosaccharide biosynthesis glycosyltransferase n=1 Tax=Providencia alcalifaciens TaxID=126385 RepID=A0A346CL54_9GAMM|nr:glycosyltransferase family 2 protein [Providencia alcalifaciens]AXL96328.1 lipooligosaccharide biosynthesis glycosyltransferase [Providencia alcalifaciens]MTC38699.1 glycosyltransferase [Providencia alcalifaciens]